MKAVTDTASGVIDKEAPALLAIGAGLPPVPQKLVNKIQAGEFVEMVNISKEQDGSSDEKKGLKQRRRQVMSILEWVQCFSIYIVVIGEKSPERVKDLLGYQALLLEAHMEYEGGTWMGYDRSFRQSVAASPSGLTSTQWQREILVEVSWLGPNHTLQTDETGRSKTCSAWLLHDP